MLRFVTVIVIVDSQDCCRNSFLNCRVTMYETTVMLASKVKETTFPVVFLNSFLSQAKLTITLNRLL